MNKFFHIIAIFTICLAVNQLAVTISKASATVDSLAYTKELPKLDIKLPVPEKKAVKEEQKKEKEPETDYKVLRAQEIAEMSKEYGLYDHRELLIAHLLKECGEMSEYCGWVPGSKRNDSGWAIGMAQWHLCYRERPWLVENKLIKLVDGKCVGLKPIAEIRDMFFRDHPDMRDWRTQAHRYLKEISSNAKDGNVESVIRKWNARRDAYLKEVKDKKSDARKLLSSAAPHYIVIHHTGFTGAEQKSAVENAHKKKYKPSPFTHSHIAYHFLIGKDGTVVQNRALFERTGHTACDKKFPRNCKNDLKDINNDSIAIVLAGNFNEEEMTEEQELSLHATIFGIREQYDIPMDHVIAHRDASSTACPGEHLASIIESHLI